MDEKTLNDLLECSVCLERLDTSSKVLPCQHTFCRKCLEVIVQSHQELRCPECRVLIESKIEELPPNVLLMRILEGMKNTAHNQNNSSKSPKNLVNFQNTGLNQLANNSKLVTINNQQQQLQLQHQQQQLQLQQNMLRTQDDRINLSTKNNLTSIPHAKAIYDFISKETGDLTIKAGDIIIMRKRLDHNWCIGELNGREGAFPLNHVQIIIPLQLPQCKTLYDFRMGPNEDEGCLTFKKGTVIHVIRRVDHNWAEGRIGDNIGIFPIAFVEMNSLAKHLMDASAKHIQHNNSSSRIVPPKPFENTSSDSSSTITTSPNSSSTSNTSSNSSTAPSSPTSNLNTTSTEQRNILTQHNKSSDNKEKRTGISSKQISLLQTDRHSAEILNSKEHENKTPKPSARNSDSTQSHTRTNNHKLTNYQRFQNLPAVFEAIYPYKPQNPDELELKKGSVYYVTERCEDGWLKGSNRSKKSGVFPGNYVVSLSRTRIEPNTQQNSNRLVQSQQSQKHQAQIEEPNSIQPIPGLIPHHTNPTHQPPELPPRNSSPSSSSTSAGASITTQPVQSIWSKPLGSVDALFNRKISQTSSNNQIKNEKKEQSSGTSSPTTIIATSSSSSSVQSTPTAKLLNKDKKESATSSAVNLMKRLTNMKRSKSPTTTTTSSVSSINVNDDSSIPTTSTKQQPSQIQIAHVRSGSCPSQLLQSLPLDLNNTSINGGENSQSFLSGSKRLKNQQGKERPSLQDLRSNTDAGIVRNKTILNEHLNGAGPSSSIKQQINNNSGINLNNHNHNYHQMPSSYHRKSQSLDASTISSQLIGTPSKNKTHQNIRERFICIVPYPPNSEYELELHIGDIVFVHKKRENGWYKGTGQRTGKTGLFPASFVEPDI